MHPHRITALNARRSTYYTTIKVKSVCQRLGALVSDSNRFRAPTRGFRWRSVIYPFACMRCVSTAPNSHYYTPKLEICQPLPYGGYGGMPGSQS